MEETISLKCAAYMKMDVSFKNVVVEGEGERERERDRERLCVCVTYVWSLPIRHIDDKYKCQCPL